METLTDVTLDAQRIRAAGVLMSADRTRPAICQVAVYVHDGHAVYAATDSYGLAIVHDSELTDVRAAITGIPALTIPADQVKLLRSSTDTGKLEGDRVTFGPTTVTVNTLDGREYPRIASLLPAEGAYFLAPTAFSASRLADMSAMDRAAQASLGARHRGNVPWRLRHCGTGVSVWTWCDLGGCDTLITFLLMPVRVPD